MHTYTHVSVHVFERERESARERERNKERKRENERERERRIELMFLFQIMITTFIFDLHSYEKNTPNFDKTNDIDVGIQDLEESYKKSNKYGYFFQE